jgi:hypothetical protein
MPYYLRALRHSLSLLVISLVACAQPAHAQDTGLKNDQWLLQVSPYTYHYHYSPDHRPVHLIGVERYNANSTPLGTPYAGDYSLWGLSYFTNSFGQPSGYAYYGGVYDKLFGAEKWYFKWTAGVLYGYKPPYENKVPYNHNGWSPGVVFGPGYKFTPQLSAQLNALGNAGAMISFTYQFK